VLGYFQLAIVEPLPGLADLPVPLGLPHPCIPAERSASAVSISRQ
jgi:hypothetical protein